MSSSQDSLQRRMAALFLLAVGLLAWQAPRTRPLVAPAYETVARRDVQVYPVAVPNWDPPEVPAAPAARREFLERRSVPWPGASPEAPCDLYVRVSLHHWTRRPVEPARLALLRRDGGDGSTALRWTGPDFLDDDDGDGDPLDAGELRAGGPGAEAEVLCRP
ncbi:MAG TPA: hypothetical protein VF789_30800 [Thermoanaerobaculia bacterium]